MRKSVGKKLLTFWAVTAIFVVGGCEMNMDWWKQFQLKKEQPSVTKEAASNAYVENSRQCIRNGELENALDELERAIQVNPSNSEAYTTIGDIYRHKGEYIKACNSYKTACIADQYAFRPHYNLGVTYQILATMAEGVKQARIYLNKAVHTYIRATVIKPDSFDAHLNLGACYFQLGQFEQANEETAKANKLDSDNVKAINNLGIIAEMQGDAEKAISYYKTSIEYDPNQVNILLNLASLYTRTGKYRAARSTYEAARKIDENNPATWQQIGVFCYRIKYYQKAIKAFQYAIHLDPQSPGAYRGLGVVCMTVYIQDPKRTDLYANAIAAWKFSLQLQPKQPDLEALLERYEQPNVANR
ncbi:MAG TPA: tetratricopeptide repeat protein [Phycisphaerae bacterium]|nr:tetratricopeptide repeat protein [Phycisphaerae bacterium]HPS52027.1 tetratricopeptide repeat protein [Phycisphaerae bacterium]